MPQPATPPIVESHDARNMRLNRPQSPHLTIYKFQITSMLSISHRFTGLALSAYVSAIGITSLVANKPVGELIQSLQTLDPTILGAAKILLIFPFTYHFANGIRHLVSSTFKVIRESGILAFSKMIIIFCSCGIKAKRLQSRGFTLQAMSC